MNARVEPLAVLLRERQWLLATAESCTGGMIAAACTDLAGSSEWFERGFVTYSNEAKTELLGVDAKLVEANGAVSEVVARAMAFGAVRHSRARVSVAVTGIAGPSGGTPDKPVGTVWFAFMVDGRLSSEISWIGVNSRTLSSRRPVGLGKGVQKMGLGGKDGAG